MGSFHMFSGFYYGQRIHNIAVDFIRSISGNLYTVGYRRVSRINNTSISLD
jgi:hypothetical protein